MEGLNELPAPIAGPASWGRTPDCGRLGGELDGSAGSGPADGGTAPSPAPSGAAGVTAFLDSLHAQGTSLDGGAPPAPAPAPAAQPPAAPAAPAPGAVPPAPAPAGEPPAAPGPIPYDRFQEVIQQRNQLQQQVEPWAGALQAFQAAGLDPQTALQRLLAPAAPAAPSPEQVEAQRAEEFHAALMQRGLNPFDESMDRATYDSARALWDMQREARETADQLRQFQETQRQAIEQQRQAQAMQQTQLQLQAELAAVVQAEPLFQDPTLGAQLQQQAYALYALELDQPGGGRSLAEVAQGLAAGLKAWQQGQIAAYAAGKQQDQAAPVVTGGGAPAPVERAPVSQMNATQRQDAVMGWLSGTGGA